MTDARKELLEQAYELAEYIRAHPAKHLTLYERVAVLSQAKPDKIEPLAEETAKWLEQFKMQGKE